MGINVDWDTNQKQIIRQNYGIHWSWDEYLEAFRRTGQLAQEVDYPIGLIAEVADLRHIPRNAVMYGSRALLGLPSNIVLSVVITRSSIAKTMLNVITKVVRFNRFTYASSVEEARQYIETKINPG